MGCGIWEEGGNATRACRPAAAVRTMRAPAGKNGETVKALQTYTGATIQVRRERAAAPRASGASVVWGTAQGVGRRVCNTPNSRPCSACTSQQPPPPNFRARVWLPADRPDHRPHARLHHRRALQVRQLGWGAAAGACQLPGSSQDNAQPLSLSSSSQHDPLPSRPHAPAHLVSSPRRSCLVTPTPCPPLNPPSPPAARAACRWRCRWSPTSSVVRPSRLWVCASGGHPSLQPRTQPAPIDRARARVSPHPSHPPIPPPLESQGASRALRCCARRLGRPTPGGGQLATPPSRSPAPSTPPATGSSRPPRCAAAYRDAPPICLPGISSHLSRHFRPRPLCSRQLPQPHLQHAT